MEKLNIQTLGQNLLANQNFVSGFFRLFRNEKINFNTSNQKITLESLIEQVRQLLHELIQQQVQNQLRQIIEDNNRILKQIKVNMNQGRPFHQLNEDASFSEVHKLMDDKRKKHKQNEGISDASLERSISAFVELKVETIEQRMINVDKRLKNMQQKYETNLKSIWNVLSITQSAIFDHLKQSKCKPNLEKSTAEDNESDKKSFFGMFKIGK